jgi:hypothetical protein
MEVFGIIGMMFGMMGLFFGLVAYSRTEELQYRMKRLESALEELKDGR